jgi:hypothetical protein
MAATQGLSALWVGWFALALPPLTDVPVSDASAAYNPAMTLERPPWAG